MKFSSVRIPPGMVPCSRNGRVIPGTRVMVCTPEQEAKNRRYRKALQVARNRPKWKRPVIERAVTTARRYEPGQEIHLPPQTIAPRITAPSVPPRSALPGLSPAVAFMLAPMSLAGGGVSFGWGKKKQNSKIPVLSAGRSSAFVAPHDIFTASRNTYAPASPGQYGGPPGSFIVTGRNCPPGFTSVPLSNVGAGTREYRCVPVPHPVPAPIKAPVSKPQPVTVSPRITVSPVMQQSFTPQFSPVMQVTSASPGAVQSGAPIQKTNENQQGVTTPAPAPAPASASLIPLAPVVPVHTAPSRPVPSAVPVRTPMTYTMPEHVEPERDYLPWLIASIAGLYLLT